jgi:AAA domain
MSRLDFIRDRSLSATNIRESEEHDEIIPGFLFSRTIAILYANKGVGKTWVALGITPLICRQDYDVIYIDADNSVSTAKDRKLDVLVERLNERFCYVNSDSFDNPKEDTNELLAKMREEARGGTFQKVVVILDTLSFFVDGNLNDDHKIGKIFAVAKAIRRDGGTVLILNHSIKNGERMSGSPTIERNADTIFEVKNICPTDESATHAVLVPEKFRLKVQEVGYTIVKETLEAIKLDTFIARMSAQEKEFVEKIKNEIAKHPDGVSQAILLEAIGIAKDDKAARRKLDNYAGRFWTVENGKRSSKIYKLPQSPHLPHS